MAGFGNPSTRLYHKKGDRDTTQVQPKEFTQPLNPNTWVIIFGCLDVWSDHESQMDELLGEMIASKLYNAIFLVPDWKESYMITEVLDPSITLKPADTPKFIKEIKIPASVSECDPISILAEDSTKSSFPVLVQASPNTFGYDKDGESFLQNLATDVRSPFKKSEIVKAIYDCGAQMFTLIGSSSYSGLRSTGDVETITLTTTGKLFAVKSLMTMRLGIQLTNFLGPNSTTNVGLKLIGNCLDAGVRNHLSDPGRKDTTSLSKLSVDEIKSLILWAMTYDSFYGMQMISFINHKPTLDVINNILSQTLGVLRISQPIVNAIIDVYLRSTIVSVERGYQRLLADELTFAHRTLVTDIQFKIRDAAKMNETTRTAIRSLNVLPKTMAIKMREQQLSFDRTVELIEISGGMVWRIFDLKPDNLTIGAYLSLDVVSRIREQADTQYSGVKESMLKASDADREFYGFTKLLYNAYLANVEAHASYNKRRADGKLKEGEQEVRLLALQELASQVSPPDAPGDVKTFSL